VSVYRRGKYYWVYVWVDGIRYCKPAHTTNRRKAELMSQQYREELLEQRYQPKKYQPETTFLDLVATFLESGEVRPYHRDRLKLLLPHFGDMAIGEITKAAVRSYRIRRHAAKTITESTVNRDLEALRRILNFAVDEGILAQSPLGRLRLVSERRKPRMVISVEEEITLLRFAAPHLQLLIFTALHTGMRRGELLNQRWEHVDLSRSLLYVTKSKTLRGESREIPLTLRLSELLTKIRNGDGLVFMFKGEPIQNIKTAWRGAIRRSGIRRCRFHDLRHSFNTRLMEAGVIADVRRSLMGHSTGEDVNAIYTHVELPMKREAIQKLEEWWEPRALRAINGGNYEEQRTEPDSRIDPPRLLPGGATG
jgi:integrase